jgi:hypothetical protein
MVAIAEEAGVGDVGDVGGGVVVVVVVVVVAVVVNAACCGECGVVSCRVGGMRWL